MLFDTEPAWCVCDRVCDDDDDVIDDDSSPDVEFARFILERAGTEDARRLCRIASPIDSERTLLEKKIGFDHQKGRTRYEFDHYIEDDNWTALIAAAW